MVDRCFFEPCNRSFGLYKLPKNAPASREPSSLQTKNNYQSCLKPDLPLVGIICSSMACLSSGGMDLHFWTTESMSGRTFCSLLYLGWFLGNASSLSLKCRYRYNFSNRFVVMMSATPGILVRFCQYIRCVCNFINDIVTRTPIYCSISFLLVPMDDPLSD